MTEQMVLGGTASSASLAEAIATGQGVERPFRCTAHVDTHASASVNVVKGVWYCYVCHSKGRVDSKTAPKVEDLIAMMRPDEATRLYPESYLDWFGHGYYWLDRFPAWVCETCHLGEDALTGEATFPVHTDTGRLAGVGRRRKDGTPRYVYPRTWSASRSLFGYGPIDTTGIVALVEGAADRAALTEVGITAFATYGSGLHFPQRELIARAHPRLVVAAFDADDAGRMATIRTIDGLEDLCEVVPADWAAAGTNDPADTAPQARAEVIAEAVAASTYGSPRQALNHWDTHAHDQAALYAHHHRKD